ncbi:Protein of unknown function [Gryllus bimaculatus]|nr:Protein of unknown function [Gryllus bimaculatus]
MDDKTKIEYVILVIFPHHFGLYNSIIDFHTNQHHGIPQTHCYPGLKVPTVLERIDTSSPSSPKGKSSEEVWLSGELARDAKSELVAKTPALAVSGAVFLLAVLGFLVFGFLWPRRRRRRQREGGGEGAGPAAGAGGGGRAVERGDIEAGPYAWPKSERVYFIPDAPAAADDARFFARQGRPSKKKPPLAESDPAPVHGRTTLPRAAEMGGAGDAACIGRKAEEDVREQAARYGKTSDTGAVGRKTIYYQINYERRAVKCTKMSQSAGDGRDGETLLTNEEILRTPLVQKTTVKKVRFDLNEEPRKSTRLCQGLATKWCFSTEDEGRSFEARDIRNKKTDITARTSLASASQKDSVLNEKMNKTIHADKDVGSVSEDAHEIVGNSLCKFPDYIFVKKSTSELSVKNSPVTSRKEIGVVNCLVRQKSIVKLQKNHASEIPKTAKKILRNRDESCLMKDAEEFNALFVALLQMRLSGAKREVFANRMRCVEGSTEGVGNEKINPVRQMVPYVRNEIRETLISLYQRCAPKKSEARRDTVRKLNSQAQKSNKNKSLKKREMSVQVVAEERVGKAMIDTVGLSLKNLRDGQKISDLASQLDPKHFELIVLGLDIFQLTLGMFCRLFFVGATVEEVDAYTEIREKVEKRILTLLELSEDKMIEDAPDRKNNLTKEQIIFVLFVHLAFIEHDLSSYKFLLGGIIGCLEYSFVYSVSLFEKEELAQSK